MIDKILGLYNKNKFLFFILIVPVAVAFIAKVVMDGNIKGAIDLVNKAQDKDDDLEKQQNDYVKESKELEAKSDKIEVEIENQTAEEDWHKKR